MKFLRVFLLLKDEEGGSITEENGCGKENGQFLSEEAPCGKDPKYDEVNIALYSYFSQSYLSKHYLFQSILTVVYFVSYHFPLQK